VARERKRHVQTAMRFRTHGGKREGAGRPPKGPRSSERHERRPRLRASEPVHVVSRVVPGIGNLRTPDMYLAIREATIAVLRLESFRIVHLSVQRTHLHLIVEAEDRSALADGMKRFLISAARHIHGAIYERTGERRRGPVFADRYHPRILRTPREVRNCLAYVLNNWRHHGEDRSARARTWKLDPYSSAVSFTGWKALAGSPVTYRPPPTYRPLVVWPPRTWLLATSWRRHGLVGEHEVPGGPHAEG
jgi:REP-associated tyrosine transposase